MKTIADILAIKPKDGEKSAWVNHAFQGIVRAKQDKEGNPRGFKICQTTDESVSLNLKCWDKDAKKWDDSGFAPFDGKLVEIDGSVKGSGVSRSTYTNKFNHTSEDLMVHPRLFKVTGETMAALPLQPRGSTPAPQPTAPRDQSTVKERVKAYMDVLDVVMAEVNSRSALKDIPVDAIKDIATHISMTYRGEYGAYAPPVFERASWKDCVSPSTGKRLGDLDDAKLKELTLWAWTANVTKAEAVEFKAAVESAAKDKGWTPKGELSEWLKEAGLGVGFEDEDVKNLCVEAYGTELAEFDDATAKSFLKDRNNALKQLQQAFRSRTSGEGDAGYREPAGEDAIPF